MFIGNLLEIILFHGFLYKKRGRVEAKLDPASFRVLEFRVLRVTRERNHVADVGHAGDEQQQAFEAETETAVGRRTEAAGIEIPPIGLFGHVQLVDAVQQLV